MISLASNLIIKGNVGLILLQNELINHYEQVQIEIFNTCVHNPKSVLGFGSKPVLITDSSHSVSFSTDNFGPGIYEIKLLRLHTPKGEMAEHKDFIGGEHFSRLFFEVILHNNNSTAKTENELTKIVNKYENKIEESFMSGIDISKSQNKNNYCVFVLIKGLKTGIKYRLGRFEIFPLNKGVERNDVFNLMNHFLKNYTKTNYFFEYKQEDSIKSQGLNPVSIVHFPKIVSDSMQEAVRYVHDKSNYLLQSFSLIRAASGEILNILVINTEENKIFRFDQPESYKGNLLIGGLSGENANTLEVYTNALEKDSFKSLLVSLHKEALSEKNLDFKYLRYWNILETLAESKNYNSKDNLLDYEGNIIYKKEKGNIELDKEPNQPIPLRIAGSLNIVYNLIKECQIGNTDTTFEKVKMWFGLRNAVAHFGSSESYNKLRNNRDKIYAKKAMKLIELAKGHNPILFELKEDVKLILMKELSV